MIGRPVSDPRTGVPGLGILVKLTCAFLFEALWFPKQMMPRIAPLEPPYAPATEETLLRWMPPGATVEPLKLFRTLLVHDSLMSRMRPLGAGILGHGLLEPRVRELMILRVCARCDAISSSVLNDRLAELRAAGIVEAGDGGYALTPEGRELLELYPGLNAWAERWAARERVGPNR